MIGTPTCPDCDGRKSGMVHVNSTLGHRWEEQPCRTCDGYGLVSREHLERIEAGHRMREDRKARGLSLREEARRLGVTPARLGDLENGRIPEEPTP